MHNRVVPYVGRYEREDAGGRLVALLRSEVFYANPLKLSGHSSGCDRDAGNCVFDCGISGGVRWNIPNGHVAVLSVV